MYVQETLTNALSRPRETAYQIVQACKQRTPEQRQVLREYLEALQDWLSIAKRKSLKGLDSAE